VFDINAAEFSRILSMKERFDIIKDIGIEACLLSLKQAYQSQGKPYSPTESLEQFLDSFLFLQIREKLAIENLSFEVETEISLDQFLDSIITESEIADELSSNRHSEEENNKKLKIRKMLMKRKQEIGKFEIRDSSISPRAIIRQRVDEDEYYETRFGLLKNGSLPMDDIDETIIIIEQLKNINRR